MRNSCITISLIFVIVLFIFSPTLSVTTISLDDTELILDLNKSIDSISLKNILFPAPPVNYYRPLLILSYIIDCKIWQMEYSGYHLTNIILHLLNAIIFYLIALKLFKHQEERVNIAFFVTLLFALNPLTCESVAWISGRSDILGAFFSLIAFLCYQSKLEFRYIPVMLFVFLGLLSKENALASIPIIIIADFAYNYPHKQLIKSVQSSVKWTIILAIPFCLYLYIRLIGFDSSNASVELPAALINATNNPVSNIGFILKVPAIIAFYIKKLFIPYPLNLIINTINFKVYSLIFIIIMAICYNLIVKRKYRQAVLLSLIIISFSPAILVAWTNIAWSLYAERYLYLAIPVWAILMGDIYYLTSEKFDRNRIVIRALMLLIILIFSASSFHRNVIWQDKVTLWGDTYLKNIDNGKVLYKYGSVLEDDKGIPFFKKAVKIAKDEDWKDFSLLVLARHEINKGNYKVAVEHINEALRINSNSKNCIEAISALKIISENYTGNTDKIINLLIESYKKLYLKRPNPNSLYSLGLIYLKKEKKDTAIYYFTTIINNFSKSSVAKHARLRLAEIKPKP